MRKNKRKQNVHDVVTRCARAALEDVKSELILSSGPRIEAWYVRPTLLSTKRGFQACPCVLGDYGPNTATIAE
jgi:hypothetical protein